MAKLNLPNLLDLWILTKLRRELILYLLTLLIFWIITFLVFPKIFPYLLYPYFGLIQGKSLVFISIEEALMVVLRASFYIAVALTLPLLIVRLWKALAPELQEYEKNFIRKLLFLAIFLGLLGIITGYFLFTPLFLKFFLYFGSNFESNLRVYAFLFFLLKVVLFSVLVFQLPLLFALLIREEILTKELYERKRFYFLSFFYLLSLLFAPTDFISQILLTLFFFLFFKLSFVLARILK
ncbi:MAG: twin-arginine translocase subunit TatC [Caldimicrobium sp.]|nr:twin-arginine translocase subunit TatC [Caldimicrobium sp.]MCX7873420.1 twin-arginine translocase subunit TatC [Caldimicrobium sp.]MDW8094398.1 twin-arginine translocase subunit TatC [Caldimicrobium sp.]